MRESLVLTAARVRSLLPAALADRSGWTTDLFAAFADSGVRPDAVHVCAAIAVLEQESGFQADPPVAGLSRLVRKRLDAEAARLGPLGPRALAFLLAGKAERSRETFARRIDGLRTESDLDRLFRDILAFQRARHPALYATANLLDAAFRSAHFEDLNPVSTAGSMQVSVRWALAFAPSGGSEGEDAVRDALYTRRGGLHFGVARLWHAPSSEPDVLYRFADYNAGEYASRNAAVQHALAQLTGEPLDEDGDLLAYDLQGAPTGVQTESLRALLDFRSRFAPELSESQVRRDVREEKSIALERTETYRAIRRAYRGRMGLLLPAARMPRLILEGPKLKRPLSTDWYAHAVLRHHQGCIGRLGPPSGRMG